jgi:large subunit ribosomal protein L21e
VVKMVKASKGAFNRRTRKLKGKGTTSVAKLVQKFNVGDKVVISPMAKYAGLPHLRYSGKQGVITEKRGRGYVVEVRDFKTTKEIVVGAVHLKLSSGGQHTGSNDRVENLAG